VKERSLKNILIFPVRMAWRVFSRTATAVLLPFSGLVWVGRHFPDDERNILG
jgi:hypothetical protein|tara:strand:+ start:756 stop:911 length:156 start_codon:yes stop_codon:yes gene_type:complete